MNPPRTQLKLAALAGMVGPSLFVATFTIEGWLRPGYDAQRSFVSALALGPRGFVQILNFLLVGLALFWFSRGVAVVFREGVASGGHVLFAIIAVGLLASGPFVMDPVGTPRGQVTVHGIVHSLLGALVFTLAPVSAFVFWRRFRLDAAWRSLRGWTFAAGVLMVIVVVLFRIGTPRFDLPGNALTPFIGVIQRVLLIVFFAWVFGFAATLYRRESPPAKDRSSA